MFHVETNHCNFVYMIVVGNDDVIRIGCVANTVCC